LVSAVFDSVTADIAAATQAAMAAAPPNEQTRAGMGNIVRTVEADPRIGRLLFGTEPVDATLAGKRAESEALFVMLSGQYVGDVLRVEANERIKATARFAVGGVAQTISAWLSGTVTLTTEQLIDQLTSILDKLRDPSLYRG
jgi:hypothetical protein